MIRVLHNVLDAAELESVHTLLPQVRFGDGRMSNPDSTIKHNLQAPHDDPANAQVAQLARQALARHPELRTFAQPRQMARTTLVRYEPGMDYGWHVDEALFPSTPPMRSDLSCTIFLNPPGDYDGGELTLQLGTQELSYKLEPGSAVLYPSITIHRVTPVTRGVRLAAITWLQSWVADAGQRELLVQLEEARAIASRAASHPASDESGARLQVLLGSLRSNLFRMWSDT